MSKERVEELLEKNGVNELKEVDKVFIYKFFLESFKDLLVIILLIVVLV